MKVRTDMRTYIPELISIQASEEKMKTAGGERCQGEKEEEEEVIKQRKKSKNESIRNMESFPRL